MAQKDKIKELVGRGLNSYHTKSLQQMDRIEKKNKQQNHKISILSNELDNDYLTKTEEGSVVSLEYSKEGMVYLDELQGNTLVNYCTDGSKELTLNGDIDLEGTFVTTTEGVDNGKVDVICEGNTLINKLYKIKNYGSPAEFKKYGWSTTPNNCTNFEWIDNGIKLYAFSDDTKLDRYYRSSPDKYGIFKKNRTYIVRMNVNSNNLQQNALILRCFYGNGKTFITGEMQDVVNGVFIKKGTTSSEIEEVDAIHSMISLDYRTLQGVDGWVSFQNVMVIDVTDLPSYQQDVEYWRNIEYFEGMKSVGQDNENGHKIEILSKNKNLFNINETDVYYSGTRCEKNGNSLRIIPTSAPSWACYNIKIKGFKNGETYALSCISDNYHLPKSRIALYERATNTNVGSWDRNYFTIPNNVNVEDIYLRIHCCEQDTTNIREVEISDILIEKGQAKTQFIPYAINKKEILLNEPLRGLSNGIKDRFVKIGNKWFIERNRGIREYQEGDLDLTDVITDMTNTEYSLEVPIYEPLEINPELICYNDTTHISNNSTIPCNMKIKNSGYNAIIKPSTLYTIALDTNKSGTIGMNLGGAKATTTNNVLTLTTPATLSDDSLRLYGKGIKSSKVRLLEGDKTNWIPSHFEGMKSSFEDNVQSDDTYKMEILSNNKNVLDLSKHNGVTTYTHHGVTFSYDDKTQEFTVNGTATQDLGYQPLLYSNDRFLVFKQNKQYTISTTTLIPFTIQISQKNVVSALTLHPNSKFKNRFDRADVNYCNTKMDYFMLWGISKGDTFNNLKFKLQIEEGDSNTEYIPHKSNKIQFSSIEPLRSVGDVKDRFVFKDGKLMIERNCKEEVLNGDYYWSNKRLHGNTIFMQCNHYSSLAKKYPNANNRKDTILSDKFTSLTPNDNYNYQRLVCGIDINVTGILGLRVSNTELSSVDEEGFKDYIRNNNIKIVFQLEEPTYEEIPFELQKIILEGYENGTLLFDTNIPPTSTVTYAGETPIVKSVRLNKTEVLNNTNDINDNIVPYLMDMDYRVVCLELATETQGISMARLFGGAYEMLQRDIQSKRYSVDEYRHRLDVYLGANKITEDEYNKLGDMLNE